MQPIRILEIRCILDGITSNLPIMRRAYVAMIVLVTVFSMAWNKIVMLRSLVIYRISLATCIHTPLKVLTYTEKIQVTRGIFHGIPLESVAQPV